LEERALAEINRRNLLDRTLFSCFYDTALSDLRALAPTARIGLLISPRSNIAIVERAKRLAAEAVHPQLQMTTEPLVSEIHAAGFRVHVFTVDDPADQRRLIGWGVDGLFTNLPGALRELVEAG
jgi:glycerophosphoryl diester phosphodiesterase